MASKKDKNAEDRSELVMDDELDRELQPHLPTERDQSGEESTVSLDYINPALVDDNVDTQISNNNRDENKTDITGNGVSGSESSRGLSSHPVHYSNRTGQSTIIQEPVVVRAANGVHVIRTQQCCEMAPHRHMERPLKMRNIKIIQAFSIVAIFLFFPLGIPAMFYAFKCEKEFNEGILRGDIDLARKLATRAERLIVFSVLGALMVAVIVFAIVERNLMKDDEDYWKNRANTGAFPAG